MNLVFWSNWTVNLLNLLGAKNIVILQIHKKKVASKSIFKTWQTNSWLHLGVVQYMAPRCAVLWNKGMVFVREKEVLYFLTFYTDGW